MTPPKSIIGALAATGALALSLPGAAGAAPPGSLTFEQTFPLASRLCAKVAAGTESKRLKAHAAQVTEDCSALQSSFTSAQTTVTAARAAILPTLAADKAIVKATCPSLKGDNAACRKARKLERGVIFALARQLRAARHTYYKSIEAARKQFWAEIRAIRGESHIKADKPIPVPPV